jgi:hypothetical protein
MPSPPAIKLRVTLTGVNNAQRFTILGAKLKPTLSLAACGITVRFANIHSTACMSLELLRSTVLVEENCSKCWLDHCDIIGAGERLVKSAWHCMPLETAYGLISLHCRGQNASRRHLRRQPRHRPPGQHL